MPPPRAEPPSFREALRFWWKLGWISFGGPAGQIAIMHAELVERRRWISERRYLHALNYCMLLPGPEAQQLATYMGWLMHRTRGGIAAGVLFVLPSLFILVALSWVYLRFGQQPLIAGVFAGIKPAVVAIVLHAAWRIGRRALRHALLWGMALASFIATWALDVPFPAIVAVAALAGWLAARVVPGAFVQAVEPGDDAAPPAHARFSRGDLVRVLLAGLALWGAAMAAIVATHGWDSTLAQMARFFTQAALVTFGGAYAVLPYVFDGAVEQHGWLSAAQMIDGLALGETTPGPLIMVVAFVGFLGGWQKAILGPDALFLAGALAATVVTFVTFLPSFIFILAGAPIVEATHGRLGFTAPLAAITAAVVGVVVHLALFFAGHVVWPAGQLDAFAALVALGAVLALFRFGVGVVPLIAACGALGLAKALIGG